MRSFHIAVHALPGGAQPGEPIRVGAGCLPTLSVPVAQQAELWNISFEEARDALSSLPRMFVEPDGSLLWVSASGALPPWQLDGNLWDRAGRLVAVELKGTCPETAWDELLRRLGWPDVPVMIRLVREALFLDQSDFRRWTFPPDQQRNDFSPYSCKV